MKINSSFLLLISCLLMLFLQHCKKDTPVTNNTNTNSNVGYVKEYYTNKAIPIAEVAVYADINYLQLKEKVYTDSSGKFVTNESIYNNAYILVTKSGYFQYSFSIAQTNRDRTNNIFYLDMPAYIQTHIKNVNPVNSNDQIAVVGFPEDLVPPFGTLRLQGKNIDTSVCCILAAGYKSYTIPVFVLRYPDTAEKAMPVKCTPIGNQTIIVNIFY